MVLSDMGVLGAWNTIFVMCTLCSLKTSTPLGRRSLLAAFAGAAAAPVLAQVEVGKSSALRKLVPAEALEAAAAEQYAKMLAEARQQGALAPEGNPQLQRLRAIAARLIPLASRWNRDAAGWKWEVNLIGSKQINAFCMPGGKIAFYTGILDQLQLTDDEAAMIMGHEMAHALREHARERLAKTQGLGMGAALATQLLGLGQMGQALTSVGGQLLTLQFSRSDETDADLVGLELAARAGFNPQAAVSLWTKMEKASGGGSGGQGLLGQIGQFTSTHPSGPQRIRELQANVPRVMGLYEQARGRG
jgi:Zn-dependent protease with chaperone function